MKALFLNLFLIFLFPLNLSANAELPLACPSQVLIEIECAQGNHDFQLLKHLGRYSQPRMEYDQSHQLMVCSYSSEEWFTKYKFIDQSGEQTLTVSSLAQLSAVVGVIKNKGFKIDHFSDLSRPFSTVTYNFKDKKITPNQLFLFSGLESTFGEDDLPVTLSQHKVSTVIVNDRYAKSRNIAADTFRTGGNCVLTIK